METFTMSRKEVPRAGLVKAALARQITNAEGAQAVQLSVRHFQRLKRAVRDHGERALLHRGRGRPSPRRLPPALRDEVTRLMTTTLNLPRFRRHLSSHESAVGVCHGQTKAAGVHAGV